MTKEGIFWDWFKANEIRFFYLNEIDDDYERELLLDDLLFHLHKYCDQLFFEVGGSPDKKQDLIITAEGNNDYFDTVESLVNQAPMLEYWNVIAFKPIVGNGVVEYNGKKINPEISYFMPLSNKNSQKIGLRIYIENYNEDNQKDLLTAAYLTLDNILGEKSNGLNIGYVEIADLSSISDRRDLIELVKLPRYIEWKKSKE